MMSKLLTGWLWASGKDVAVTLCGRGSFPWLGLFVFFPAFQMTGTQGCSHTGEESLGAQYGVKVPDGGVVASQLDVRARGPG